jgi:hypothetical protein
MNGELMEKLTAKQRLIEWLSTKQYVRTSEIMRWGSNGGYSNRADRNCRELRQEGFLRRLDHEETKRIFGETKEQAYEVVMNLILNNNQFQFA